MFHWIQRFLQSPREIGSVAPSSKHLAKLMTRDLNPQARVLELGPGSGAITQYICQKIQSQTQLTLIELHAELAQECRHRFPQAQVLVGDVEDLLAGDTQVYDAILSGIPFALLPQDKRKRIFRLIANRLTPTGRFIMFQYSLTSKEELQHIFSEVKVQFTPLNIPPAFVYIATAPLQKN